MEEGQLWRQYVIAGVANIGSLSTGFSKGWTSSAILMLLHGYSPIHERVTHSEVSWIVSIMIIGCILGPFIAGFLAPRIGRKWSILSSSALFFIGWILIAIGNHVEYIYAGRILWGLAVGMLLTISPMYCAEIATNDRRGTLGSYLQVFITLGMLLSYVIGGFASYSGIAYVGIAIVSIFAATFCFMPESPIYYLTKNDKESAAKCLMTLRGRSRAGVEDELLKMEADVKISMAKTSTIVNLFRGSNFKAFYISCALVFFQQCSGLSAVLFYKHDYFLRAGIYYPQLSADIIVGAVQVSASLVAMLLVDRLGKRILLLISTTGTAVSLGLLGTYFYLRESNSIDFDGYRFLPLLSVIVFIIAYCLGLGHLPFTIISELFPVETKTVAVPIVTALHWVLTFVITKLLIFTLYTLGAYVMFWIFGVCCVLGFFFTLFVVPETKGKSFSEIQDMLAGKPPHKFIEQNTKKV